MVNVKMEGKMAKKKMKTMDGNTAAAYVSYAFFSDVSPVSFIPSMSIFLKSSFLTCSEKVVKETFLAGSGILL